MNSFYPSPCDDHEERLSKKQLEESLSFFTSSRRWRDPSLAALDPSSVVQERRGLSCIFPVEREVRARVG